MQTNGLIRSVWLPWRSCNARWSEADPPVEPVIWLGAEREVVVSGRRGGWWLDLSGYDAEAWRYLAEGVDEYMGMDDKIAYLRAAFEGR